MTVARPFPLDGPLGELRFDLLEAGTELKEFHAAEDKQTTRNRVFDLLQSRIGSFRVDSIIVEKRKTHPSLREVDRFYPRMMGYLLKYLVNGTHWSRWSELIVIADRLEEKKKRKALEKSVKQVLARKLPPDVPYRIYHHESETCYSLQVADYFNWAVYKAWTDEDSRSLERVREAVVSQFDIFGRGETMYY